MVSLIAPKFKDEVGLYRDDGIAVCKATPREIEKTKQEVCNVFKSNGLKITIEANKKVVNFLDVTFDLSSGSYKPYMKPNNKLLYVHGLSNLPTTLLENVPQNINKRLTNISFNEQVFNEAIAPYQQALDESGYNFKLKFDPQAKQATRKSKARKRKITWYNPPWDSNFKTNLGRKFLLIVAKCFPKNHPLNKIFNRHTLKLSYSSMPNMKAVISWHNKNMLAQDGLHPCNNHARVTAEIDQDAHSKEIVCKKTWCTKRQLPQKQQRKTMSDSPQISKNGIETIKHPSGTPAKEMRPSYRNRSWTSKTERSRFALSWEF